jgi:hypothetical protein
MKMVIFRSGEIKVRAREGEEEYWHGIEPLT